MKYFDVCFRVERFYGKYESAISSLLSEFAMPATWDGEGFDFAEDIIEDTKEYIAELMACNCFYPLVREDAVIVMDREKVLEIYYGFTPISKDFYEIENIMIKERSKELLLYYNYGKTDSKEIESRLPSLIESFSSEKKKYKYVCALMESDRIRITLDICGEDWTDLYINMSGEDTINDVIRKVKIEMEDFLSNYGNNTESRE